MEQSNILEHVMQLKKMKKPIIVAGVGSGITAKAASRGGADILATYNTAAYRIKGLPTGMAFLPYDDCNKLALELLPEVLAGADDTPVLVGLGAHDPRRPPNVLIDAVVAQGAQGVCNEPFIGMYRGDIRNQMEASGLGFDREVEMLEHAARLGLVTLGYAFTPEEALRLADAGVHLIGAMVGGVTSGGSAGGAGTIPLDDAIKQIRAIMETLERHHFEIPVLTHGGPLNALESVGYVLRETGAAGYITGSTGERLPIERSVCDTVRQYKELGACVGRPEA